MFGEVLFAGLRRREVGVVVAGRGGVGAVIFPKGCAPMRPQKQNYGVFDKTVLI